jgi:iron complex outermembrane recepter protein
MMNRSKFPDHYDECTPDKRNRLLLVVSFSALKHIYCSRNFGAAISWIQNRAYGESRSYPVSYCWAKPRLRPPFHPRGPRQSRSRPDVLSALKQVAAEETDMNMKCDARRISLLCGVLLLSASVQGDPIAAPTPATMPASGATAAQPDSGTLGPTTQPEKRGANDFTNLSLEDLMNVEVTSVSKKAESIAVAPAAVTVISQDDMQRSGFATIPDMLRLAPEVDVARTNSFTWAVGVRGLNDQYNGTLLVLQDGRSLYSPLFGGTYWDTVDYVLPDLDRIEIIKGPGATLWGANAVNGVINITSKDAKDTQGWLLDTRASNDESNLSLRYGGKLSDDTYYRAYIKAAYINELDDASGDNAGDEWHTLRGGFRIDKHPSDIDTLTLQGDIADIRIRDPFNQPIPTPPFTEPVHADRDDETSNLLSRWTHRFSDDSDFALQVYYDFLKVDSDSTDYVQNTFDIDFHHRFKFDQRNEITWGLGYRIVNGLVKATPEFWSDTPTRNDNIFSTFVQDTITIVPDRWSFTAGSKFEHNDFNGYDVEPSGRLLWTPNKTNSVWAAVSLADRSPTRLTTDAHVQYADTQFPTGPGTFAPAAIRLFGDPGEESEKLTAYEAGYRLEPTKSVSFDLSIFYNQYRDKQSIVQGAPIFGPEIVVPLRYGNLARGETYGGSISSTVNVTNDWRLVGSYSLLQAQFSANDPLDRGASPKNMAQIRSYLNITRHVQLNAGVYYVGAVGEFHVAPYISTDMNVAWKPTDALECSIGVLDLFDNHHPEFGTNAIEGTPSETPRTVYLQMTYQF